MKRARDVSRLAKLFLCQFQGRYVQFVNRFIGINDDVAELVRRGVVVWLYMCCIFVVVVHVLVVAAHVGVGTVIFVLLFFFLFTLFFLFLKKRGLD